MSITSGPLQALESKKDSFRNLKLDGVLWKMVNSDVKDKLVGMIRWSHRYLLNMLGSVLHIKGDSQHRF